MGNPGHTDMGGLIGDYEGDIMLSFSRDAGFGSINIAEFKALCFGLREACRLHLRRIVVEGYSLCSIG